ncbi:MULTISPECIES: hypothetical protein [Xanthomonas translucens group]|uniref:hypothetical protein n=1 Tax=Xanthomonas translucens group TaxID=3390202 RepID=UPI000A423EA3|nr:hypothetical protein [Xanthomonas translucens]UKE46253.1 hypothetical protein KHA79_14125 [Xanthomonas translucens pv. cerealis]
MLKRLKKWLGNGFESPRAAPVQMQALIEVNLVELNLASLDALRAVAGDSEPLPIRLSAQTWLGGLKERANTDERAWETVALEAWALNRELASILAAHQHPPP